MAAIVGRRGSFYAEGLNSTYSIYRQVDRVELLMRRLFNSISGSEGRSEIPQMFLEEELMYKAISGIDPETRIDIKNVITGSAQDMVHHIRIFSLYDIGELEYANFKVYRTDANEAKNITWNTIFVSEDFVDSVEGFAKIVSILVDNELDVVPRAYYVGDDPDSALYNMNRCIMYAKFDVAKIKILDTILDLKYKDEEEVVRGLNEYKKSDELIRATTRFVYNYVIENDNDISKFYDGLYKIFYEYQTGGKEDAES